MELLYPAAPSKVSTEALQPSAAFQREIRKVVLAIALFVLVYLLLVVLALLFTVACVLLGLGIIAARPSLWTLLFGFGIMFMGVMVTFFLIKFLFARSDGKTPGGIPINEPDEPQLFEFIHRIAGEVGTHYPKNVYLIPEVNASVFYPSSFWSLFFPIRKNLNIGLGLVNSLNISQLKSVLAHEFGHFSQNSMRLGSYVYYVNQAIYNMLYQNTGWAGAVDTIARIHSVLALFAQLGVWIVLRIQWVLRLMYGIVNRQYMSLSREMEFHADTIAASVAGSNNMAQALRQVTIGNQIYQQTIDACNELLNQNTAPANFYSSQRTVAVYFAGANDLPLQHDLPVATAGFVLRQRQARVVFKNQWASHPTDIEREANLQRLNLLAEEVDAPAWSLFRQPERWQQVLTDYLYREVDTPAGRKALDAQEFGEQFKRTVTGRQLPKIFNGYYDNHYLAEADLDAIEQAAAPQVFSQEAFDALFRQNLSLDMAVLQRDIDTLDAIAGGQIDTKTFDFDGQKYPGAQAPQIKARLEAEAADLLAEQNRRDADAVRFFYGVALAHNPSAGRPILDAYRELYTVLRLKKAFDPPAEEVLIIVHYLGIADFELANNDLSSHATKIQATHVPALQGVFRQISQTDWADPNVRAHLDEFLATEREYVYGNMAHRTNLEKLCALIHEVNRVLNDALFQRLKQATELQAALVPAR